MANNKNTAPAETKKVEVAATEATQEVVTNVETTETTEVVETVVEAPETTTESTETVETAVEAPETTTESTETVETVVEVPETTTETTETVEAIVEAPEDSAKSDVVDFSAEAEELMKVNHIKEIWRCPVKGYWFTKSDLASEHGKKVSKKPEHYTL